MNVTIIYLLVSVCAGALGQIMLKKGMSSMGPLTITLEQIHTLLWQIFTNPFVIIGLCVYVGSTVFWLVALSRVNLSYAYPFASLSYIVMLIAAWRLFDENISLLRVVGALTVGLGVFLISRS